MLAGGVWAGHWALAHGLLVVMQDLVPMTYLGTYDVPMCRIPDNCIDSRRYPLFLGRAVMQELIKGLRTQARAQVKRKTARGSPS